MLFKDEIWKMCQLITRLQIGKLETHVNELVAFANREKKIDERIVDGLASTLEMDLSVRDTFWKEANTFYHESNWSSARLKLESADQIQEEAASKLTSQGENLRFIGTSITGSIGHMAIAMGIRARMRILGESKQNYLVISSKSANDSLLHLWQKYFPVLSVSNSDAAAIERNFWPLFDHVQTVKTSTGVTDLISAHNRFARAYELNANLPVLTISQEVEDCALDRFKEWGWDPKGWFVTFHIRENKSDIPGYGRNADPETYLPSIRKILDLGGNVVRIDNRGMSALPKIDGFMDLSQSHKTDDWLDLFLMARCKFFVGTTSGPLIVPSLFGTRILATNAPDLGKFVYLPKALMLPKRVRRGDGSLLTLRQQLNSPAGLSDSWLKNINGESLFWDENSPGDILSAVEEMLDDGFGTIESIQQQAFEEIIEAGASDSTLIAKSFLAEHSDFLK